MKIITELIARLRRTNIHPLGRWKLEYDTKIVNNKIDLSNEDHCGPCGQYVMKKMNDIKVKDNYKVFVKTK